MPDPYERHARSGWEWGSSASRSQSRAAAAQEQLIPEIIREGRRPPGKKDKDLCKAQHWKGPHTPGITITRNPVTLKRNECCWAILGWRGKGEPYWFCRHVLICSGCGKDFGGVPEAQQCPQWHPLTPQEREALDEERRRYDERLSRWKVRRKPLITGPQGYRRKRDG
jgi:hypothetical protein